MCTKEHYIRKAKRQRGLTDEQIEFFLQRHPRWDLLPWFSFYVKHGFTEQEAFDEVVKRYGMDPTPRTTPWESECK